jgi:hypothetical protein
VKGWCPRPLDEGDKNSFLNFSLSLEPRTAANFSVFGGGKRDRTADLLHAMQALSQLSYTPDFLSCFYGATKQIRCSSKTMIIAMKLRDLQTRDRDFLWEELEHRID